MLLAEVDTSKQVLTMSFSHHVDSKEMKSCLETVRSPLFDVSAGFQLVTDLTHLDSMDAHCSSDLGEMMSLCNSKGISTVARVVPDPTNDIGFSAMGRSHYGKQVKVMTYKNLADAIHALAA